MEKLKHVIHVWPTVYLQQSTLSSVKQRWQQQLNVHLAFTVYMGTTFFMVSTFHLYSSTVQWAYHSHSRQESIGTQRRKVIWVDTKLDSVRVWFEKWQKDFWTWYLINIIDTSVINPKPIFHIINWLSFKF